MVREAWKRRVNAIQEVNLPAKILIVPDVFNVVVLAQVEIESHCGELAFLTTFIDERGRLHIRVSCILGSRCR